MPQYISKDSGKITVVGVVVESLPKHSKIVFVPLDATSSIMGHSSKSSVHGIINSDGTWHAEFSELLRGKKYMLFIGDNIYHIRLPLSPGKYDVLGLVGV